MEIEWGALASIGSKIKRGRLDLQNSNQVPKSSLENKGKYCFLKELIMTHLFEFNKKKHQYTPVPHIKEKQYVCDQLITQLVSYHV